MTPTQRSLLGLVIISVFAIPVSGQVSTGTPPFGSFGGGPDVINLGNLNSHLTVPVLHKNGRAGMNFAYDLNYDTSVWYPVNSGSTKSWQPVSNTNWGWKGSLESSFGYVGQTLFGKLGCSGGGYVYTYAWSYHDSRGAVHGFGTTMYAAGVNCKLQTTSLSAQAWDGSGYFIQAMGATLGSLYNSAGQLIKVPINSPGIASATLKDRNGNEITVDGSGNFYDTLNSATPVLTVSGSGTAVSPMKYTYTAPSGASPYYQVNYTNYTVATNFGISGINEYKSSAAVPIVTSIILPDGSQYGFGYETTPGTCTPYSGTTCTTARLTSVTFPTGGTITYGYSGGNNGILPDGSTATLTRATPDTAGGSPWIYVHSESGTAWTTLITDPQGNQTNMDFQGIYETERQVYQGPTSGALLRQLTTCYNGNTSSCNTTAITLSVTQRTVIDQYGSTGLQCKHNYLYNAVGGLTEQDDYDYGSGSPGSLLRKTIVTFASLGNITAFRQTVTVCNGTGSSPSCNNTGTVVSQTTYNYDETGVVAPTNQPTPQHTTASSSRGNLTSINYPVGNLKATLTYFDTGNPQTSKDVNGGTNTFNYGALTATCGNAFPTGVTEAISALTQSYTWNCTGGVQLTSVDENNQTAATTYNDLYFWRPNAVTDEASNATGIGYESGGKAVVSSLYFNNNNSLVSVAHNFDGLGRPSFDQRYQSPGGQNYDTVSYTYDANGRPYSTSVPCSVGAGANCAPATPKTTQTYDALNRPIVTTDGGGGTATNTYTQNDVLVTVGPGPTGENTKRRNLEYDALSRLTSVCEITTLSGSGTCAQTNAQTGYWTKYTYDALGDLTGVTQNAQPNGSAQTRSYSYDSLGRLSSETNPENGTTTYVYDSDSTCGTYSGDLVKRVDAAGNTMCSTHDALHRVTSITYPSGPNISVTPMKVFYYDTSHFNTTSNTKGRLASAGTCLNPTCAGNWLTAEDFSYSARGETTDVYEATPHTYPTFYHISQTYWPNGAPNVLGGNIGLPTITYGVDGEGRTSTASASSGQNPITSTTYNIFTSPNQLTVTFGSGDSDVFGYDPNTMRMNKYQFKIGTQTVTGTLGWNANGSLGSLNISDPFSTANTQNCSYAADDLARISQVNCGTIWGQNFTYDPLGNITKTKIAGTGATSFTPTYQSSPSITNRVSSVGGVSANYDANGNSLNDTFRSTTWDAASNPITIGTVSLAYDAFDRMVEPSVNGTYSEVVYNPLGVKLALMSSTSLTKAFVPLTGGATAVYNSSGLAYYRHTDHLGSSRLASTPSQALYSDTAYSPFGEPYAGSGAIDNSFTGQNQDTTAGLYDFLYREHDPNQARWTSPDPAGLAAVDPSNPQSWNRYAYVLNNPLAFLDPSGLSCITVSRILDDGTVVNSIADDGDGAGCADASGGAVPPVGLAPPQQFDVNANGPDDQGILDVIDPFGSSVLNSCIPTTETVATGLPAPCTTMVTPSMSAQVQNQVLRSVIVNQLPALIPLTPLVDPCVRGKVFSSENVPTLTWAAVGGLLAGKLSGSVVTDLGIAIYTYTAGETQKAAMQCGANPINLP